MIAAEKAAEIRKERNGSEGGSRKKAAEIRKERNGSEGGSRKKAAEKKERSRSESGSRKKAAEMIKLYTGYLCAGCLFHQDSSARIARRRVKISSIRYFSLRMFVPRDAANIL